VTASAVTGSLSRRQLAVAVGSAVIVAGLVLFLFVLPAEFRIDPTGFGRVTGLTRLARLPYRSDAIDIPLAAAGAAHGGDELEYKVHINAGESFVYSWSVADVANPEEFYYDFHGEAPAHDANSEPTVVEYRQSTGTHANVVLIAPITGVHGWYLQNQSERPAVVHLRLSGFYELVPPGEYGNEAGIEPKSADR
jgi:hypothetical protein